MWRDPPDVIVPLYVQVMKLLLGRLVGHSNVRHFDHDAPFDFCRDVGGNDAQKQLLLREGQRRVPVP